MAVAAGAGMAATAGRGEKGGSWRRRLWSRLEQAGQGLSFSGLAAPQKVYFPVFLQQQQQHGNAAKTWHGMLPPGSFPSFACNIAFIIIINK